MPGPDGDSGEAEGCQGAGPRGRRHLHSRSKNEAVTMRNWFTSCEFMQHKHSIPD